MAVTVMKAMEMMKMIKVLMRYGHRDEGDDDDDGDDDDGDGDDYNGDCS